MKVFLKFMWLLQVFKLVLQTIDSTANFLIQIKVHLIIISKNCVSSHRATQPWTTICMVRNPNQNHSKKLTSCSYSFINCKFINRGKIHLRFPNFNLSISNYNWTSTHVKKLLATRLRKRNSKNQQFLNKRKQFTKSFDSRS